MATKLATLKPRLATTDMRRLMPAPKQAAPIYRTEQYQAWALAVKRRAGWRCEAPGCSNGHPDHRMYADHRVELRDGGNAFDLANGTCLCASHHTAKTLAARAERMAR